MADADIKLLFGVKGGNSIDEGSGDDIKRALENIIDEINRQNLLKVKIGIDTEAEVEKSWTKQLQDKLNAISESGKFYAQISKLTLGSDAISDFRNQLNAVINTLHLDKGTTITLTAEGIGEIKSKMQQVGDAASDAARKTVEAARERAAAEETAASAIDHGTTATENAAAEQKSLDAARKRGLTLLAQMQKAERNWTAAKNGASSVSYSAIQFDTERLKEYLDQLEQRKISVEEFNRSVSKLQISFSENSNEIKAAGENTKTFGQRLGTLAEKFSTWLSVSQVIMLGVRSIKQMAKATIELDDAMTQLKIVTRDTESAYARYLDTISKTAVKVGSSISDLIDSTTTYARLGYSLKESSELAEFTAMLQNVGDINVSDAQDAITSIVKAFKLNVDEIESVMDKLVITGNNFPISVDQIAEGMTNASSALSAAGNTFEQSVALLTAANTTIQNASKSSTGLRTIAARLRSTTTELEELGETMTEDQYGDLVAALTKYNVALTDINGEFRSTYDIVADIAKVWNGLSTMEQSALANAIAGTRQQAVFFSLVEQFQEASGAMDDMANSAGTLQESYSTYMESTTAHINQFKAAFQSLAESTFSTDLMNGFIDAGTSILGIIEGITNALGVLGTVGLVLIGKQLFDIVKSAGRPEIEGFITIVPAYALAVTRNELAA